MITCFIITFFNTAIMLLLADANLSEPHSALAVHEDTQGADVPRYMACDACIAAVIHAQLVDSGAVGLTCAQWSQAARQHGAPWCGGVRGVDSARPALSPTF